MPTKTEKYYLKIGGKVKDTKVCLGCGTHFNIFINRDLERKKYCSRVCLWKMIVKKHNLVPPKPTKKVQEKIAKTLKKKRALGLIPKPPASTPESRRKAGLKMRGHNHSHWIQDRTKLKLSRFNNSERRGQITSWRNDVFNRDNYTCQWFGCNQKGGILNAHHIKSWARYPKLRFQLNNGKTLCVNHHKETHYGKEAKNSYSLA